MKRVEVKVPSLGESITEGTVAKWFKNKGEFVNKDEVLLELETDKVSQEIYAQDSGVLAEVFFDEGEDVKIGETLAAIDLKDKQNTASEKLNNVREKNEDKVLDIIVPTLGESITEATIGKWLISKGDKISKGEVIVEIETDKVTQELFAEESGVLQEVFFKEQEEVKIGEIIAKINVDIKKRSEKTEDQKLKDNSFAQKNEKKFYNLDPTKVKRSGIGNKISLIDLQEFSSELTFSPSAKRIIKEQNLDVGHIKLEESKKRINKYDLLNSNSKSLPLGDKLNQQENNTSEHQKPMSKLRQSIASRLKHAQNTAAMLTTFNEIDMSKVIEIRKRYKDKFFDKYQVKLGFMSIFTKAVIIVLKEIPEINAEIRDNNIIYKNRYDIGIAVGTDKGLFVPVIRNADAMSYQKIESEIVNYGKLAKEGKLGLEHMKDGTFTISNGGVYGSMLSTPILNAPQSGILGLHNIVKRPWVVDDEIVVRPIMYVALTYDHRIIDGKEAVTFLVRLKEIVENPEHLIFEI